VHARKDTKSAQQDKHHHAQSVLDKQNYGITQDYVASSPANSEAKQCETDKRG